MELAFGDITVACTNTDRVVFPDVGITKGDVIRYYADLADVIVPELRGRPLTVERFTKGVDKGGFYQKHAQKHYPPFIDREELGGKTRVVYPIVNDAAGLVYMVNQGGFVLHIWTSRRDTPWNPDLLVFDLDPPDGALALVRDGARIIRDLLEQLGLTTFVKTTGSKGLHVVAPLDGTATFDEVGAFCARINTLLCTRHPDRLTTEFYKKDRKGRLFLDTMRNTYGATVVAPYSLRGRPSAPVSTPIRWDELDTIAPDEIRLPDVRARLDAHGDPWRDLRAKPGSVTAAAAALDGLARP